MCFLSLAATVLTLMPYVHEENTFAVHDKRRHDEGTVQVF